jgi:cation diffusion facilitator family transporter
MAKISDVGSTHRSVIVSLGVNGAETLALAIVAWVTGSVAMLAQTLANAADLAVGVFLLIGVLSSLRPPDDSHPLGYGRERFFWSLFAALGIFMGGAGLALDEAVGSALNPVPVDSYPIAYLVLVATVALDVFAVWVAIRPLRHDAIQRGISLRTQIRRSTDPVSITVVVGGGCAVIGGVIAMAGLALSQMTGSPMPDTVASALIGLLLIIASVLLLRTNRELLTGRGVSLPMQREMRRIVAAQEGVVDVPDLFAVVVGPASLIVDGDVTFANDLNVRAVERSIMRATAALRERWSSIKYVYLMPVSEARPRRGERSGTRAGGKVHRDQKHQRSNR